MGKDSELVQAVKTEDLLSVQRIISKLKSKHRKSVSSKKSPLNFQDDVGFSALHHASLNGNCRILGALLDNHHHIIVDLKDNKGMRPLHYASWQGRLDPVRLLLQAGADPNEMSLDSETPLHLASQYGSFTVVEALLQYDADPTAKNKQGKTPLDLAAEFGKCSVAELLLNGRHCMTLIANTSHTGVTMHTPLHLAAKNGHSDVIRILIDAGIDLNRETPNGTALHEAALAGKSEVVRLLIMSGIDVRKKNSHSQTALDIVNKFTPTRAAQDIKQILREAIGGCQAQAIKDYSRIHDRSAISFKAGDIVTVLERNPDGKWKGSITKGAVESIGYFPGDYVQLISRPPSCGGQSFLPSYGNNIMPSGQYQNPSRSPSVDNINNHRYSTGSTASASSSGTWSNREVSEHSTPVRGNPVGQSSPPLPPPPQAYTPDSHGSDLPPPPPELMHHGSQQGGMVPPSPTSRMNPVVSNSAHYPNSPSGNGAYYNQFQFPASAGSSPSHHGRGRPSFDDPPWLRSANNRPPSGTSYTTDDGSSDGHSMRSQQGLPSHYQVHSKSLVHTHPAHSMDNMLVSDVQFHDNQRPHSDGISDFRVDAMPASHGGGKDADRIFEWLRRQRLMEYTNNFTKAGYDMPVIAKMTPEDLTAVGITKPNHRKRITAMIAQMRESDPLPPYIPGDIATWLTLLDLSQYLNTLMTNGFSTMEEAYQMTWEDLQDIGINRLGHQKKLSLAVKRLKDLKKRGWIPGQHLSNDSGGSGSPQSSVDGVTPLPAGFHLPLQDRASPMQSSPRDGTGLAPSSRGSGIRSSRESLGSDLSNRSAGSSSQDTTTPVESHPQNLHLRQQQPHQLPDASYVPEVKSAKLSNDMKPPPSPKHATPSVPKNAVESPYGSFSTFKQPNAPHAPQVPQVPQAQTVQPPRVPHDIDRLIGLHRKDGSNRDSIGSSSSLGSGSGSGSGDHSSLGSRKSLPPAPPKRTNSIITAQDPEKLRTATIGRKKSMKPYHDRENAVAAGMARHPEITSGFATIKRNPSRKTDTLKRLQRSQSHDAEPLSAIGNQSMEGSFKPPAAPVAPKVSPDRREVQGQVAQNAGQDRTNISQDVEEATAAMIKSGLIPPPVSSANHMQSQSVSPNQSHLQGNHLQGKHPQGNHLQGNHPHGSHPQGNHLQGNHPQANHPQGNHIQGMHLQGNHPQGNHPQANHPQGNHLQGNHLQGNHPQGHHLQGSNLQGNHLQGNHPQGNHPQGNHPQGNHPSGNNDQQGIYSEVNHPQANHLQGNQQLMRTVSASSAVSVKGSHGGVATPFTIDPAMQLQNAHNHSVQIQQEFRQDVQSMGRGSDPSQYSTIPQSPRRMSAGEQQKNHPSLEQSHSVNHKPPIGPNSKEQMHGILNQMMESKQESSFRNGNIPHSKFHLPNDSIIDPSALIGSSREQGYQLPDSHSKRVSKNRTSQIEKSLLSEKQSHSYGFVMPPPSTATSYDTGRRPSGGSENSSNSSESSGQQRRPNSMEMLWKKQPQSEDCTPVLPAALSNPLQGIWRPKSRHQNRNSNIEMDDETSTDTSSTRSGEDESLRTQATFLQLKKQFLNTDSHPLNYQTLKRPPKKPEPLAPEFRSRSRSFTEQDEFNQSPVSKNPPFSFETMNRNMNANSTAAPHTYDESGFPISSRADAEVENPAMSSFKKPSPTTSPRHTAVNLPPQQMQSVPRPMAPSAPSTHYSMSQQAPVVAPSIPVVSAVPPPPMMPPPAVPVAPKTTPVVRHSVPMEAPMVSAAPPSSSVYATIPPPPMSIAPPAPHVVSSVPPVAMPPPPPPMQAAPSVPDAPLPPPPLAFMTAAPPAPPPVPPMGQAPPPPPPPPPTNAQLTMMKQSKKASSASAGSAEGGSGVHVPKKMPLELSAGSDMMAELKMRQKKRQKVPVVSETWESNSDTIKRKPPSPNALTMEEVPNSNDKQEPAETNTATVMPSVEVKKKQAPPVVLPKSKSPSKLTMPQHTPPPPLVGDKPQQRLIPVEASPDRTGPSTDILNQPVSSESLNKMLVPLPEPKKQLVPVDDSKDIDVFSSDMDKLEDQDEVIDSDSSESSDTLDMSIGGFASENTDTIKKQPTRLSPRRSTASEQDAFDAEIIMASASPVMASSSISRQQSSISNPQEKTSTAVAVDSFTDATSELEEILRSMAMEDPLAELVSEETHSQYTAMKAQTPPAYEPPPPAYELPPPTSEREDPTGEESKEVFNDIESMFADLALDLDSMLN